MNAQTIGLLVTWLGALVTAAIALYTVRANRNKTVAETELTKTQTAAKTKEAAAFDEDREDKREAKWEAKIRECEDKFEAQIDPLRRELAFQRRYIERHIPWDWTAVRELRMRGVEIDDPPTLVVLPKGEENP